MKSQTKLRINHNKIIANNSHEVWVVGKSGETTSKAFSVGGQWFPFRTCAIVNTDEYGGQLIHYNGQTYTCVSIPRWMEKEGLRFSKQEAQQIRFELWKSAQDAKAREHQNALDELAALKAQLGL